MPLIGGINITEEQMKNPRIRKAAGEFEAAQRGEFPGTEIQKPTTQPLVSKLTEVAPEVIRPSVEKVGKAVEGAYDIISTVPEAAQNIKTSFETGFRGGILSTAAALEETSASILRNIGLEDFSRKLQTMADKDAELSAQGINVEDSRKFSEKIQDPAWLAQGFAQNLPNMLFSMGVALPAAVAGAPTLVIGGLAFGAAASLEAGFARREAKNLGANDETADKVAVLTGIANGMLETIPVFGFLNRFSKGFRRAVTKEVTSAVFKQATSEASTEGLQEIIGNAMQKAYVDTGVSLITGLPEAVLFGGLTGGVVGGAGRAAGGVVQGAIRPTFGMATEEVGRSKDEILEEAIEIRRKAMEKDVDLLIVNRALDAIRKAETQDIAEARLEDLKRMAGIEEPAEIRIEEKTITPKAMAETLKEGGFEVPLDIVEKYMQPEDSVILWESVYDPKQYRQAIRDVVERMKHRVKGIEEKKIEETAVEEPDIGKAAQRMSKAQQKFLTGVSDEIKAKLERSRPLSQAEARAVAREVLRQQREFGGRPPQGPLRGGREEKPSEIPRTRQVTERALLKLKLSAQAVGAKAGAKVTREQLTQMFREKQRTAEEIRTEIIRYIKEHIDIPARGKFLQSVARSMTKRNLWKEFTRVGKEVATAEIKELQKDIGKYRDLPSNVAVEGKKLIEGLLNDIDFTRVTKRDAERIRSASEFLANNEVKPQLRERIENELKKLANRAATQKLGIEEMRELRGHLERLKSQYQLKEVLQNLYDQREFEKNAEKLAKSTKAISRVEFNAYKDWAYPAITADVLDGSKGFGGENVKLTRGLFNADVLATGAAKGIINNSIEAIREVVPAWEKMTADQIHEQHGAGIIFQLMIDQKAWDQAQQIIDSQEWAEEPKLSEEELRVVRILREPFERIKPALRAVFEEDTNEIFQEVENYFPIKYEDDGPTFDFNSIKHTRHYKVRPFRGFTFERKPGVKRTPRTDFLSVFDEAVKEQIWYSYITPQTLNAKALIASEKYAESLGEAASQVQMWWIEYLDSVARRGWSSKAQFSPFFRGMNVALVDATLGYKVTSIVMQPFSVFPLMGHMSANYGQAAALETLKEVTASLVIPGHAMDIIKGSEVLKQRAGGEIVVAERMDSLKYADSLYSKVVKGGLKLLVKADVRTAAGIREAFRKTLAKYGSKDPDSEADFLTELLAGSSHVTMRPPILTRGDIWKTIFAFQSYFMSQSGNVLHTVIKRGLQAKSLLQASNALVGLGIVLMGYIAEEITRDFIASLSGRDIEEKNPLSVALLGLVEEVPLFGRAVASIFSGQDYDIPLVRMVKNLIKGGKQAVAGKTTESKIRGALKASEAGIVLGAGGVTGLGAILGISEEIIKFARPVGVAQIFDILEGVFSEKPAGKPSIFEGTGGGESIFSPSAGGASIFQ